MRRSARCFRRLDGRRRGRSRPKSSQTGCASFTASLSPRSRPGTLGPSQRQVGSRHLAVTRGGVRFHGGTPRRARTLDRHRRWQDRELPTRRADDLNASPRDHKGQEGAYESSLVGTKMEKPEWPLEILRTIHSFDPCMACAIHMIDAEGKDVGNVSTELNVVLQ